MYRRALRLLLALSFRLGRSEGLLSRLALLSWRLAVRGVGRRSVRGVLAGLMLEWVYFDFAPLKLTSFSMPLAADSGFGSLLNAASECATSSIYHELHSSTYEEQLTPAPVDPLSSLYSSFFP